MQLSDLTARKMYEGLKVTSRRRPFGYGRKIALVNVDLQRAYTDVKEFSTAYEGDPRQIDHINAISAAVRSAGGPVIWTYLAYDPAGDDCGVWGTRTNTPDSLQNFKIGTARAELDPRLKIVEGKDSIILKKMASAFHETHLRSLLCWHQADTVIVTGGSTSGCVRATVVDSLSCGFRTIVPEECVADVHESPHFASLYDIQAKYADVNSAEDVLRHLRSLPGAAP